MSVLITAVIVGLGFAFFATQNTLNVPINLGIYSFTNIPIYLLALGSLLVGLVLSWIISIFDSVGAFMSLRNKDSKLRERDMMVSDLQNKIRNLELENAKLKGGNVERPAAMEYRDSSGEVPKRNIFDRIRQGFAM